MTQTAAAWLVIILAVAAANLPFMNQRLMSLVSLPSGRKGAWLRLLELAVLYCAVGAIAALLEARAGQRATQGWEFYAVTAALFVTSAFPGYVYCYLLKHRS
jgi:uncharacterized protein DUF2818